MLSTNQEMHMSHINAKTEVYGWYWPRHL